ncbi:SusD/RagB family nutrient-binding outer membrane lipoprotein [Arcicella sp. LKC2W]|uniref:SusD/RagB family nutrient-binding outer membrane lipoprotein n=1 Tax=Arcicella sp. LKC2W TaxID=2984198 RepID=UPI002B212AF2|nr:SusD/RagB family nutrient-binding outer membrane lipoprotein [Arcicella sp. LKC2W]MEA5460214.1 SusD/RagB family nutrient-binding outer membrane lipoprotein [Arcicella sp. LKC2W]
MKKILFILSMALSMTFVACQKSDFEESYADPSKISVTTVEKQFTGFLGSNKSYVLPDYGNYFVVLRTTLNHYTQVVGWENSPNQYNPGSAGINDRWTNYYNFLAQYRELEKIYAKSTAAEQADKRIYKIASAIYFYDHTQKVVDLHGDIPFSSAGMLSINGGDYTNSFAKYDNAETVYTKMLDDLKAFADEMNTITVKAGILTGFKTQDFVNKGDLMLWKKYCNSLRIRMLMRASSSSKFQSRATAEMTEILANPTKYPVVSANADNIQINVFDINTEIHSKGFRNGLEDWDGNLAGKAMIDHMNANKDPRIKVIFEAGDNAVGVYKGLDPLAESAVQSAAIAGGTLSRYNRSTFSRNQFFPGVLINAAEVSFFIAEFYLKNGNNASAKTAYENGIKLSTEAYYKYRTLSNDNTVPAATAATTAEVQSYINSSGINWANANTDADKLSLIANQKWIHYGILQQTENWAEIRRFDLPKLSFQADNSSVQKQPPLRWVYPSSEAVYNTVNYSEIKAKDNLTSKIFWDNQ